MKIEIDLNEILGDENGVETLQESVRRKVIESLEKSIKAGVQRQIGKATTRVIDETLRAAVTDRMPAILDEILTSEYVPVNRYGERAGPTTFKKELVREINEQMK